MLHHQTAHQCASCRLLAVMSVEPLLSGTQVFWTPATDSNPHRHVTVSETSSLAERWMVLKLSNRTAPQQEWFSTGVLLNRSAPQKECLQLAITCRGVQRHLQQMPAFVLCLGKEKSRQKTSSPPGPPPNNSARPGNLFCSLSCYRLLAKECRRGDNWATHHQRNTASSKQ